MLSRYLKALHSPLLKPNRLRSFLSSNLPSLSPEQPGLLFVHVRQNTEGPLRSSPALREVRNASHQTIWVWPAHNVRGPHPSKLSTWSLSIESHVADRLPQASNHSRPCDCLNDSAHDKGREPCIHGLRERHGDAAHADNHPHVGDADQEGN